MSPLRFVVSGHATLDYVVRLGSPFSGAGSAPADFGAAGGWARPGGATFYTASRLAAAGHEVAPIAWLGENAEGDRFVSACASRGMTTGGLDLAADRNVVRCLMIYQPDGQTGCMIDEGGAQSARLTAGQTDLVAGASHVIISAGPAMATADVLRACDRGAVLAWIMKDDPRAFPADLCAQIAARAEVIFCTSEEMPIVRKALGEKGIGDRRIIETRGRKGVLLHEDGRVMEIAARPVIASDTTGAGDSLAGEILAMAAAEHASWKEAIDAAVHRISDWLTNR